MRISSAGILQWTNTYNYNGYADIPYDLSIFDGQVTVTGGSQSSLSNWDYATVRYNGYTGAQNNVNRISGNGIGFDHASQVVTDNNGNIYITGSNSIVGNGLDIRTIKFDSLFNVVWNVTYDYTHSNDHGNSLTVDDFGNIYVAGYSGNGTDEDYLILKYDDSGNLIWNQRINKNGVDIAKRICMGEDNAIYITGISHNSSNYDFLTISLDTSGTILWEKRFNGAYNGQDLADQIIYENGYLYVSGSTEINGQSFYITIAYGQFKLELPPSPNPILHPNSMWFYEQNGQIANDTVGVAEIDYYALGHYPALYFKDETISYLWAKTDTLSAIPDTLHRVDQTFLETSTHLKIFPYQESEHHINYYLAHCTNGVINQKGFQWLAIDNLYRNTDLYYTFNASGLQQIFVSEPGTKPIIKFKIDGAISINIDSASGTLSIVSSLGEIVYNRPTAFEIDAQGNIIPGTLFHPDFAHINNNDYLLGSSLSYNVANGLVIVMDRVSVICNTPVTNIQNLSWATWFGGIGQDVLNDIIADSNGNTFITGFTNSSSIPFPNNTSPLLLYSALKDFMSARFNELGVPIWQTYFGSNENDEANSGSVFEGSQFYTVGLSNSSTIPIIGTPFQATSTGNWEKVIAVAFKYSTGILNWSTFCTGTYGDLFPVCTSNNNGDLILAGHTHSYDFPISNTGGVHQAWGNTSTQSSNSGDGFLVKFDSDGNFLFGSLFGGEGVDAIRNIEYYDGKIYATGFTGSLPNPNNIPFGNPFSPEDDFFPIGNSFNQGTVNSNLNLNGNTNYGDAFIAEFDDSNNNLLWCTYVGGGLNENELTRIKGGVVAKEINGDLVLYISGNTQSSNFPITPFTGGYNQNWNSNSGQFDRDIFITKFVNRTIVWNTLFGSVDDETHSSLAIDFENRLYIGGETSASNFQTANNYCTLPANGDFPLCDQINNLPNYDYYFNPTPNALKESYIASFNQAQQILFSGLYAGEGNDIIKKIEYSNDPTNGCRLLICGSTNSPCELPAVNSGVQNLYFQSELLGQEDGFIGRMDLDLFCTPLTSFSKESSFEFRILPNPNNGNFNIEYTGIINEVKVYNLLGQSVNFKSNSKPGVLQIDLVEKKGVFIVEVLSQNKNVRTKIIVQ